MSADNCSASWYPAAAGADQQVTAAQQHTFDLLTQLASGVCGGYDPEPVGRFGSSLLVYNVWGTLMFIFLVCAAIPMLAVHCCACCADARRGRVYQAAFPRCGCSGWLPPTVSFLLNWTSLVCLSIGVPFTLLHFGWEAEEWSCALTAAAAQARGLLGTVQDTSDAAFYQVTTGVDDTVGYIDGLLDEVGGNTSFINGTIARMTGALESGCANITSTDAYEALQQLATSGSFQPIDCSTIKGIAKDVTKEVGQVMGVIAQAKDEVASADTTGHDAIAQAQGDVQQYIDDANRQVTDVENRALQFAVDIYDSYPPVINTPGTYTVVELTVLAAQWLPQLATALCGLTFLSACFYGTGILALLCAQCKQDRARETRLRQAAVATGQAMYTGGGGGGLQPLMAHVDDRDAHGRRAVAESGVGGGACGRSLTRAGCAFGYCGALVMAVTAIVGMTVAPVFNDAVTAYYVAPHDVATTVRVLVEAGAVANLSNAEVENFTLAVDVCLFGAQNSSAAAAAEYFGYDVSSLIDDAVKFAPVNFSSYGNVTDDVNAARLASATAESTLQSDYSFTTAEMATADAAADNCCQYEDLFKLWVSDCSDPKSQCYQCQAGSARVCTPGKVCDPAAGSPQAECRAVAQDARTVMRQANALVDAQHPRFTDVNSALTAIEDVRIEENINGAIARFNGLAPGLVAEVRAVNCSAAADVYFGLYGNLLQPAGRYLLRFGSYTTAIAFHSIVLAFLTLTVNKRLGSGGGVRPPGGGVVVTTEALPMALPHHRDDEDPGSPRGYEQVK